jgi:hypothetical protein
MIELVRTLQRGKMNKDLDERLVPNGEYRDALNIEIDTSETSGVGTAQNLDGNLEIQNNSYNPVTGINGVWLMDYITSLSNPKVIGGIRYDQEEKIYWLIASDSISAIAEYDQTQNIVAPVLVDTQNILRFSDNYLVTGINIIDGLLFFTDNQTEPKKVNIAEAKRGSIDFMTHTQFYGNDFVEADIAVIKKSPLTAPTLNMATSRFGNDVPGTGITPIPVVYVATGMPNFTYVPNVIDGPEEYRSLETYSEWLDITNNGTDMSRYADSSIPSWNGKVLITPQTATTAWVVNDTINLTGSLINDYNQVQEYQVTLLIESINSNTLTCQIQAISSNITRSFDSSGNILPIVWEALITEKDPMFRLVFPRFALRWKYRDGEYSCFSPFTNVAFIGDKFEYIAPDGYNIGMTNNVRKLILENIPFGSEEVIEVDILYKETHSPIVYVVDTIKVAEAIDNTFEIKSEIIGKVVDSSQILRHWDNVPRMAKAQEISGNRLIYGNYLQNYTINEPVNILVSESTAVHPGTVLTSDGEESPDLRKPFPSIKSIRTYQAGVVYADQYGRETPVITSKNASYKVEKSSAKYVNKLKVKPTNQPPAFATHYKVFIKETSNEYYNLALDRFYFAEDGNVWLSFPSSERNKIDEETYLILKKQHDKDTPTDGTDRYKVLAIEDEAPEFISTFKRYLAFSEVELNSPTGEGYLNINFDGPLLADNPAFGNGFTAENFIKIIDGGNATNYYKVASGGRLGGNNVFNVTFTEPLGTDATFLNNFVTGDKVTVEVYKNVIERLPEFEGRFFVKINRDFAFDTNIVDSFSALEQRYGVLDTIPVFTETGWGSGNNNQEFGWYDSGNPGGSSSARRPWGHRNPWKYPGEGGDLKRFTVMIAGLLREDRNDFTKWRGGLGRFLNSPGKLIRFSDAAGNKGKIYTIESAVTDFQRRGYRSHNSNYDNFSNGRKVWNIVLRERYSDFDLFTDRLGSNPITTIEILERLSDDGNKLITSTNPAVFETEPKEAIDLDLYYQVTDSLNINTHGDEVVLNWHNCYSYGNGVESNRIRDDFNAYTIGNGTKASTVLDEPYAQERRGSGLIFSQIFNSTAGVNRLNQFIQAEAITKDLNPAYGSIQKLHSRDSDLITLCEDKCLRILANKDALFNADGNVNVTSNNNVLGQALPYAGEYGISKNPESFASYGFRVYFSDKNRGAIMRLSMDGLTNIADAGMSDFFADNLVLCKNIYGSYDENKGNYNVTLTNLDPVWQAQLSPNRNTIFSIDCNGLVTQPQTQTTVSFSESVEGWTSRKSFIPEFGISLNNTYFTFKNGRIWQHGLNPIRNNFYGIQYDSSINIILNDSPLAVKSFKTLNYTGTQSRKYKYLYSNKLYSLEEIVANQTIPSAMNQTKTGWYVNYITTDLESGIVKEFLNKENKWFNHIKSINVKKNCNPTNILSIGNPVLVTAEDLLYNVTLSVSESCSTP